MNVGSHGWQRLPSSLHIAVHFFTLLELLGKMVMPVKEMTQEIYVKQTLGMAESLGMDQPNVLPSRAGYE